MYLTLKFQVAAVKKKRRNVNLDPGPKSARNVIKKTRLESAHVSLLNTCVNLCEFTIM